ncbi:MAG TPA: GNAT family N-acetyltransferase [bacterium]|nr:GNAT family N-acetyltransferase [bacterium]HNS49259.1 GNAT family N-acetyltransferase [bacterium]
MEIRGALPSDVPAILEMTAAAWAGVTIAGRLEERYGKIEGRPWHEYKRGDLERFCVENLDRVLVALEGDRLVGYATYSLDPERRFGTVQNNAVHPDFRGRGIGSALHRRVLDALRAAGMTRAFVTTLEVDEPAQRMYTRHGFRELARSIHYSLEL